MGVYAATFEDYERFGEVTPWKYEDQEWGLGRRPVINVSCEDARAYCAWLGEQTGRAYRLPSEAEWEYACRAGSDTPFHFGPHITTDQANFNGTFTYKGSVEGEYRRRTVPVGSFPPNAFGLYDMHGNVWEWCQDQEHRSYRGAPSDGSAWEGEEKEGGVLRGGSWDGGPRYCRAACRLFAPPGRRYYNIGFRVCCSAPAGNPQGGIVDSGEIADHMERVPIEEPSVPATHPARAITLLHLSDTQFGRSHRFGRLGLPDPDARFDTLFARLCDDLRLLKDKHGLVPDLVIASGDLAEWGKKKEFDDVLTLLTGLTEVLRLPRERVVIVPGNHDINRDSCAAYFMTRKADDEEPVAPYWPKWEHFHRMFRAYYGDAASIQFTPDEPWSWYEDADLKLAVAGLNSTMAESHRDADHHGYLGEKQLRWFAVENIKGIGEEPRKLIVVPLVALMIHLPLDRNFERAGQSIKSTGHVSTRSRLAGAKLR
jgi:Sulfatase-modifying factor enzyme 1/Calcineurin-like phosphoesterase